MEQDSKRAKMDPSIDIASLLPKANSTSEELYMTDDILEGIYTFLLQHLPRHDSPGQDEDIEIEAKFGHYIDKRTEQRLWLPITTPAILKEDQVNVKFESDMSVEHHKRFNQLLNERVQKASHVQYKRQCETDKFYTDQATRQKIRVTFDTKTGGYIQAMRKERMADLAILMPTRHFDVRLSINRETKIDRKEADAAILDYEKPISFREKNRLSYTFSDLYQVDLTQVDQQQNGMRRRSHELELEWINLRHFSEPSVQNGHNRQHFRLLWCTIRQLCSILAP